MSIEVTAYGPEKFIKVASGEEGYNNRVIPGAVPTLVCHLGMGAPVAAIARSKPKAKPPASLPFGLVLPEQNRPRKKGRVAKDGAAQRPDTSCVDMTLDANFDEGDFVDVNLGDGDESGAGLGAEEAANPGGDAFDDDDTMEIALPHHCHREFEAASIEDSSATVDAQLEACDQADSIPKATSLGHQVGTSKGAFFNKDLGITGVSTVSRTNMVCFHCNTTLTKGEARFSFAFAVKRPERSIHVGCLAQIPATSITHSVKTLDLLVKGELKPEFRDACQNALLLLRARAV